MSDRCARRNVSSSHRAPFNLVAARSRRRRGGSGRSRRRGDAAGLALPGLKTRGPGPVVDLVAFDASHLAGVLALCEAQGWPSLPSDPVRAETMLNAPSATTVVAIESSVVVGVAFA